MRLYEKILIGLVLFFFTIQLLPYFPGKAVLFAIGIGLLAVSYLIGGFWLLNATSRKKYFIPIIAGIAFAASLVTLPFAIRMNKDIVFQILPFLNIVFFIGMTLFLIINRKSKEIVSNYKSIYIRSSVILIVVSFFAYAPISFKPYRAALITLNNDDEDLISNIQMFQYREEFEDAMENGDCERAIDKAIKANEAGKAWLDITAIEHPDVQQIADLIKNNVTDSIVLPQNLDEILESYASQNNLWKISGTYVNLYRAYKCKAVGYFENADYEQALSYYLLADESLNACEHNSEYWDIEKLHSIVAIANCYKKLSKFEYADSLFVGTIDKYLAYKDARDRNLAFFYSNLAASFGEQLQFEYSNMMYKAAIVMLRNESNTSEIEQDLIENYQSLIKNHFQTDSLEQALYFIEETLKLVAEGTVEYCNTNLYYGLYYYKMSRYQKADDVLSSCLECYKKILEPTNQNIAESHLALAQVKMALAAYDMAGSNLDAGIAITIKNYGTASVRHASYLKAYAHLDKEIGNYNKSEQAYKQVLEIYTNKLGARSIKLPEVLAGLADLEVILSRSGMAKAHSDSSLAIAKQYVKLENPAMTSLTNSAAYVNYSVGLYNISQALYENAITINTENHMESNVASAIAFNGLGLVMSAKKKYKIADSLFLRSLRLHQEIFTDQHPFTAVVYLNFASLKIEQNKLSEAKEMLERSQMINKSFFDNTHIVFADILVAYGDLAKKKQLADKAEEYYENALVIYLDKFDETHLKVKSTRRKLSGDR